ncbi:MAG TPA: hypothetical protein VFW87_27225 [Pirellulales bacterium]|nr:hypothetical protein [Pirellulales bacterium]
MSRLWMVYVVLAAVQAAPDVTLAAPETPSDADRELIESILSDWRQRAEKLGTIRCVAEGTATVPKGCYNGDQYVPDDFEGDVPSADHTYPCRYEWLFDFQNNRFRIESHKEAFHMEKLIFVPDGKLTASDGQAKPRRHMAREWNSSDEYAPSKVQPDFYLNLQGSTLTTPDLIILLAHGTVAREGTAVSPKQISAALCGPGDFVVHGRAERGGRECVVLRSLGRRPGTFLEYWVDRPCQGAVVHWESRVANRKRYEFNIDYQQVAGLWLPSAIEYTKYRPQPENPPELLCRMDVTEIEPNLRVAAEAFVLEPKAGMIVSDQEAHSRYRFGDGGGGDGIVWWILASIAIAAAIGLLWWRRRDRRTAVRIER